MGKKEIASLQSGDQIIKYQQPIYRKTWKIFGFIHLLTIEIKGEDLTDKVTKNVLDISDEKLSSMFVKPPGNS